MKIEIITPDATVFKGDAMLVQLPGAEGSFELLENHAPLIAILKKGKIKIQLPDKNLEYVEVNGGVVEVHDNHVLILAE